MRKFISMVAITLMMAAMSANAQIATENSNALDNIGLGVTVGLSTPLDLDPMFPLNANFGLKVTKDITPVVGFQVEGLFLLNDNHFLEHFREGNGAFWDDSNLKTFIKASNVGANTAVNLTNLFCGYNGTPRAFEASAVLGVGWFHMWNTSTSNVVAKTGFDLAFNIGKKKAHSVVVTPAIYWNLNKFDAIHLDKRASQIAVNLTYVYHFKNSNGTHHFKTYDVGAMQDDIAYLRGALAECNTKLNERPNVTPKPLVKRTIIHSNNQWTIQFAQDKAELTEDAKETLNNIPRHISVDVVGTASPEGEAAHNQELSERRAAVVADYLTKHGINVRSSVGKGVQLGESTNRLVIVTIAR